MIQYLTVNGNQPGQSARGVRAFRVLVPSINGGTFSVDSGGQQNIVGGHLYEFQPRAGESVPGVTSADVETNRLLREMFAAQTGMSIEEVNSRLGGPTKGPNGNPKQYPTITFSNGTNSMPLIVAYDQEDGNEYVPGSLGLGDTVPVAQEGDLVSYGFSLPALNNSGATGFLGVPIFYKDTSSNRLTIPAATNGQAQVTVQSRMGTPDQQFFDTTSAAGAAINSGTINIGALPDILLTLTGLTAGSTRVLTVNAVRQDTSTEPIFQSPAAGFGAGVTNYILALGLGANLPATPIPTISLGQSFAGSTPTSIQFNLSAAGADTVRMTIWGRNNS